MVSSARLKAEGKMLNNQLRINGCLGTEALPLHCELCGLVCFGTLSLAWSPLPFEEAQKRRAPGLVEG